jgi:hypothetical protein
MYWFGEQCHRWRAVALIGGDRDLVPIPGYEFSGKLSDCAASFFAEVPGSREEFRAEIARLRTGQDSSAARDGLLRELAECVLVLLLNSHLIDYFRDPYAPPDHRRAHRIEHLSRDHFAAVLESNRPLRLITEDIAQRPIFTRHPAWADRPTDDVWSAGGRSGAYFRRLAPALPQGTTVTRDGDDSIQIDTPHQRVRLTTRFRGCSTHLPIEFLRHYAKVDPLDRRHGARPYEVVIDIDAKPKPRAGMPATRPVRRAWLEDFLTASRDTVDFDAFLAAINWPTVAAVLRCLAPDDRSEATRHASSGGEPEAASPNSVSTDVAAETARSRGDKN